MPTANRRCRATTVQYTSQLVIVMQLFKRTEEYRLFLISGKSPYSSVKYEVPQRDVLRALAGNGGINNWYQAPSD